jgi:hypothetical protein
VIKYYNDIQQGTPEWLEIRRGILTASEVKLILTPTLKLASNDKEKQHVFELAAQRISGYVEPHYISDDMLRGRDDEVEARNKYAEHYHSVQEVGFVTNTKYGFTLGYSPDGLVGDEGLIEAKSRRQKYQVETITTMQIPDEHILQCQTGLLVTERKWLDYISYSGGLPMCVIKVFPDFKIQEAIVRAGKELESGIKDRIATYDVMVKQHKFIQTKRTIEEEIDA